MHVSLGFWLSGMLLFMAVSGSILAFPFMRPLFGASRPATPHVHATPAYRGGRRGRGP
ncbi:hypothetical protein RAA17_21540 [Komagataeibacter rhaeticus]|nr:hypothetical protein [Komagataeibacter rhaeticus]